MSHEITEAEWERMKKFAGTPKYKRNPGILEPDDKSD